MSVIIDTNKHNELVNTLKFLISHVEKMLKVSSDSLLVWQKNEMNDWMRFLMEHTNIKELQTLENEINNRFFYKYNIRIEPQNLDDRRLEMFEKLIHQFYAALH